MFEHPQALFGFVGDVVGYDQVAVCAAVPAPDTPADLVELGEPEAVRAGNDEGVGVGYVQSVLDDRGAYENLSPALHETGHGTVQRTGPHLSVGHVDGRVAQEPAHPLGGRLDRLDPVVQKEDLAAAVEFPLAGLGDQVVAPGDDMGEDGHAIAWRSPDEGQIANARERKVERPGDGRGRQRQHVHRGAQPFEPLLLPDAEPLLLIDDHETRSRNATSPERRRWVPITMSTVPSWRPATTSR